jgi:hypothetical protein
MDQAGRIIIQPQFEKVRNFSDGLAAVRKGEHWSYIDKKGKVVIIGRFNDAKDFKGGLALVHEGGRYGRANDGPAYWMEGEWIYVNQKSKEVCRFCTDDKSPIYDP